MLLEGIRAAIKQCVSLAAVMRLLFTERWQSLALSQLIQPASPPRATLKHPMEIGPCYKTSLLADGTHPAKICIKAQPLAGFRPCGAAMVQLKSLELESAASFGPSGQAAALSERFVCGKYRMKRQEPQACLAVVASWCAAFQTFWI